jgi:hypothetical protein
VDPSGPQQNETESRGNPKKLTEHTKRERKSGARNTYREEEKETSRKKDRSYWTTKTNGKMRHPFSEESMNPESGRVPMTTAHS